MDKDEALGAKKPITGIKFPTDKAHRVRNRVDEDEVLGVKKPICHGASCMQANDAEGRKTID